MDLTMRAAWRGEIISIGFVALLLFGAAWLLVGTNLHVAIPASAALLAGVVAAGIGYRHFSHRYYIEDGRVEHRHGIIAKNVDSLRIADLRNVNVRQSVVERILGIGSVEFSSAAGSGIEISWTGVRDPSAIKQQVEDMRSPAS